MKTAISVRNVSKTYLGATVLHDVDLEIAESSLTVLSGPSGSGKTTLLNIMSGLELPDGGTVHVADTELTTLTKRDRTSHRAQHGHVFQRSGLLGGLTVEQNVLAGHVLNRQRVDTGWIKHLGQRLEVGHLLTAPSSTLSGGQAQRIAVIRALAHRPRLVFADEPTAALDVASTTELHALLRDVVDTEGITIVMVSHDPTSAEAATAVITLRDGRVQTSLPTQAVGPP